MIHEGLTYDRKALAAVTGSTADWEELAKDVVAFAAARGGIIEVGIADDAEDPPADQRVDPALADRVTKRMGELTVNVSVTVEHQTAANGGEFLRVHIPRSHAMPSRTDGRHFLRVGDSSKPAVGDILQRLVAERSATPWEVLPSEVPRGQRDAVVVERVMARLRASDRVKVSVKEKTDDELLDHYHLTDGDRLTNLGVLCVGSPRDRARLGTAPVIQAITYDERRTKIGKLVWDDHTLSLIDMVDAVWEAVPAFRETYELRHGILAQEIPAFDRAVIREVVVNALVHRPYTQRGDIFLNLHPDRLEVVNPGPFPPGVTPANILHTTVRRNDMMARLFHDLHLMEREGSGYDLMYATLLSTGRGVPIPVEGPDRVEVTIPRRVVKPAMIDLMQRAADQMALSRRETITLGLLALHDGLTAAGLAKCLELTDTNSLSSWLGRLLDMQLVATTGRTKGMRYFVPPQVLQRLEFTPRTTLTRIETHRLDALIREDLSRYPESGRAAIHERIGSEIPLAQVKRALERLREAGVIASTGKGPATRYQLVSIGSTGAQIPETSTPVSEPISPK